MGPWLEIKNLVLFYILHMYHILFDSSEQIILHIEVLLILFIFYTSAWAGFEIATLVVIGTDFIGSCVTQLPYDPDHGYDGPINIMLVFYSIQNVCVCKIYIHDALTVTF
jgi:hypothetical protein